MLQKSLLMLIMLFPSLASASTSYVLTNVTTNPLAISTIFFFIIAYIAVVLEEFIHLRKSKPVILCAGIIWIIVGHLANQQGMSQLAHDAVKHNILEFAELFLFLLAAMTYINAMEERQVFDALRVYLVNKKMSYRKLFWTTGIIAFFLSPVADNLTTALVMCSVVMAVGKDAPKFILISCINIVVAANAGGAFSPFGDITTLMVWQAELVEFQEFFVLFIPAVVNFLIPAFFLQYGLPKKKPPPTHDKGHMLYGAKMIMVLFVLTIITAVSFHKFLHLPPAIGMMTGLAYLKFFGYHIKMYTKRHKGKEFIGIVEFDIFKKIQRAEWDTLLFFYGIILCVGGLSTLGYLELVSDVLYNNLGTTLDPIHHQTPANIIVGVLSALIDNIPVMFAVLVMNPEMSHGQWLLVTLTCGVGGSLLSIGSAAGVALMGQSKGHYTFFGHLKWAWAIALGYAVAILAHIWLNIDSFHKPVEQLY